MDTNHLIDSPEAVAEPEIDAEACAEWLRGEDRDWWEGIDLPEYTDESPFTQALRLAISSLRG